MKIVAKKDRKLLLINTGNTQNENKAETIELTVPEEYEDYNKKIVFVTDDGTVWDIIQDNTYKLTNAITKYKQVDFYIWLTKEVDGESIDFRTKTKTLNFYRNVDASDEITPEEISGVNTVVNILEEEITKVDSLETELRDLITDIQNKLDNGEFDGEDGYTPQKGVDYFTEQDIEEIETDVKNDLEENVLVNYSLIAETGAKIELSINTTDYKLKAILKDKNNNIIHTSNVIDLPLETMVVNATYDNTTKKIILTLQNGTTVEFSVADLVSGLVSESQLQTILSNYYTKIEINNLLNNKVDKVQGKELSSNDFTDEYKEQIDTNTEDIEDIQEEQTEQNTEIEKLQTENARLKATLPTTTGEGKEVTLDKTAELEFKKPPLPMGNSEQETNLYNGIIEQGSLVSGEPSSSTSTNRIRTKDYIKVVPNTTLPISFLGANNYVAVFYTNDKRYKNETSWKNSGENCEILSDIYYMKLVFKKSEGLNITPSELTNLQIGNIPNPDYPQEITNVTGDVEVKVQNKNLFDKDNVINAYLNADGTTTSNNTFRVSDYINIKGLDNITISGNYGGSELCCFYDKNKEFISSFGMGSLTTRVASVPTNAEYVRVTVRQDVINKYQLEQGSTPTNFAEHKEQTLPLTLGNIELCKIGDYQDYFYKESNKWYLHKEISKRVFNGTEAWYSDGQENKKRKRLDNVLDGVGVVSSNIAKILSNLYRAISADNTYTGNTGIALSMTGSTILIYDSNYNTAESTASFKQMLSNNNLILYYALTTPTDTEITDTTLISQLEAINNALSYEEQTNISGSSNGSNPLFSVEAYQDAKVILAEKGTYSKPSTGIPSTDLASAVQTSLGKADTAIQEHQDISGKANKISVVQTSASTIEINSNTFYKFGEVASLNITLASITDNTIYNEYMFEFVSGTTATTLTLPSSIKWLETPTIDANKIYQCSIVDNVGLLVGVTNV